LLLRVYLNTMKKYLFFLIILIGTKHFLFAQNATIDKKRDYQWLFGYKYDKYTYNLIDFSKKKERISGVIANEKGFSSDIANICDREGNLVFHTNGCYILDKNHKLVSGSQSLNAGIYKDAFCKTGGGLKVNQASMFLPTKETNKYFLFHTTLDERGYSQELMQSTITNVDSLQESKVVEINKKIIKDSLEARIIANRHANGRDWWVFMCNRSINPSKEDIYYSVLVSDDTVQVFKQTYGRVPKKKNKYYSQICFSPDGTKFARYREQDSLYIFDFDRATGRVSNKRGVSTNQLDYYHGVAFSSNSRFVYALSEKDLFQIDTYEADLEKGKELIAVWDGFKELGFPTSFHSGRLAPDCKIYVTTQGTTEYLSIINYPNRKGKACGFEQHSLLLPATIATELPNYPYFRLGAIGEKHTPCDSTISPYIVANSEVISDTQPVTFAVYPNPAQEHINVDLFGYVNRYERGTWELYNLAGQQVAAFPLFQGHAEYNFDISSVPNGVYVWRVSFNGVPTSFSGKVVILKE
jgi:hypothetical protein